MAGTTHGAYVARVARAIVVVALVAAFGLSAAQSALATPTSTLLDSYVTNGPVNAVAQSDGTLYLGGSFSQVGPRTGSFVGVSSASGQANTPYPQVTGTVTAMSSDGSGGYFIGGTFTAVDGTAINDAAHIRADGTLDTSWKPNPDGGVYALAVSGSGSTVYLGGNFTQVTDSTGTATVTRNDAAAVDATTGRDTGWNPNPDNIVEALAVSGSTVYLGGEFDQVTDSSGTTTVTRNFAAAVDATTGRDTGWNPAPNGDVDALAVAGSTVYLGGNFSQVTDSTGTTTVTRSHAAAVDATTGRATSWNPNPDNTVTALAVSGSTVYLGGNFTHVADSTGTTTVTRNDAAAVDATTGRATGWNPNPDSVVEALVVSGSTVYLGGNFTHVTDSTGTTTVTRNNAAAVDATSGRATGWNPNPDSIVNALAVSGSTVYLGGSFNSVNGVARSNAAALDSSGTPTGWNPGPDGIVDALALSGSTVYLGGFFSQVTDSAGTGTVGRANAAAVDATTGRDTGWNPSPNSGVEALAVSGSTVYLGGNFTQVTDSTGTTTITRNFAAAVDAATGRATSWNPDPDNSVRALAVSGARVYLGGEFSQVTDSTGTGMVGRTNAAAVDATTGRDTGWNPNPDNAVLALAVSGSTVYLGGEFRHVTDSTGTTTVARNRAAAVDATTGRDTGWNPNPNNYVFALVRSGSTVYLGGEFSQVTDSTGTSTVPRSDAAAVDATTGRDTGWNPSPDGAVNALALSGSTVYLGGAFISVGLLPQSNLAEVQALQPPSAPTVSITAPADHASYGPGQVVNASYSCQEGTGGPGLATTSGCVGTVPNGSPLSTSTPGTHAFTVTATSQDGQSTTQTLTYTVAAVSPPAAKPPTVTITSPGSRASYRYRQDVTARYSCTEGAGGQGLSSCKGTLPAGRALNTKTAGTHSFTVTARSSDGLSTTRTISYRVLRPSNHFTVKNIKARANGTVTFKLTLPSHGTVDILETTWTTSMHQPARKRFVFSRRHLKSVNAGTRTITVAPGKAAVRLLHSRGYKRHWLRLSVTYTPTGGLAHSQGYATLPLRR